MRAPNPVLRQSLRSQRRAVVASSVLWTGHQLGEIAVPVVVGATIDRAVATGDGAAMVRWLIALAVVFAFLSNCYRFGARIVERSGYEHMHELVLAVSRRVLHPAGGAESVMRPGELSTTVAVDSEQVADAAIFVAVFVSALAALLAAVGILLSISVVLGVVLIVGLPPILFGLQAMARPIEARAGDQREQAAAASGVAADMVMGLRVLKGLGAEQRAADRYDTVSRRSLRAGIRAADLQALHDLLVVLTPAVVLVAVVVIGGRLAVNGSITVGELVAAVGVSQFLIGPILRFGWCNSSMAESRASARRIERLLDVDHAVRAGTQRPSDPVIGRLELVDLGGETFAGLSLEVEAGTSVGIAFGDPAGAAELVSLLGRHTEPSGGSIRLDGHDVAAFDLDALREVVVVAPHDGEVFGGTIVENVLLDRHDDRSHPAIAVSGTDEVVRTVPGGMGAVITERGRSLSGGQRQRIALARALAAEAPVLVLHEPTTAVDAATEGQIAQRLRHFRAGHTTVMVTTSPALLASVDRVVLVLDGSVVAAGTHASLVADERYADTVLR